jgi:hypothetical protein
MRFPGRFLHVEALGDEIEDDASSCIFFGGFQRGKQLPFSASAKHQRHAQGFSFSARGR